MCASICRRRDFDNAVSIAVPGESASAENIPKFFDPALVGAAINGELITREFEAVLRQVVRLCQLAHRDAEIAQWRPRTALFVQQF
jgi:hypothetical protein